MVIWSKKNHQGGVLLGVDLQGEGGETQGSFPNLLLILVQAPLIFPFPSLYLYLPRDTFLRMGHWTYLLSLGSVVTFPQNPTINPFFTNYSCSPKIFSPIVSFNEPSEYVFNMFSFTYSCDFFPGQDNRSLLISAIKW